MIPIFFLVEGFRVKMFLNDILTQNLINIGAISEKMGQCCVLTKSESEFLDKKYFVSHTNLNGN